MKKDNKKNVLKKKRRNILSGVVSVQATFNNTIVTVSDTNGNVISWSSSGKMGFKGSKKSTPFAAQKAVSDAIDKAKEYGLQSAKIQINGTGVGRDASLRSLVGSGITITSIEDLTYCPHNGCRPPKRRRQ